VRCCRFVARKNWFVAGSDDFQLRVFNYNTHEKVIAFEAHPDYIRCLTVHPTASIVFTGSDDMSIKAWDWDKQWKCIQVRALREPASLRSGDEISTSTRRISRVCSSITFKII